MPALVLVIPLIGAYLDVGLDVGRNYHSKPPAAEGVVLDVRLEHTLFESPTLGVIAKEALPWTEI